MPDEPKKPQTQEPIKKLTRNTDDKMIAGVCSGLANYFKIDTAIIRLLFVVFAFGYGSALLLYILMWILVPTKNA